MVLCEVGPLLFGDMIISIRIWQYFNKDNLFPMTFSFGGQRNKKGLLYFKRSDFMTLLYFFIEAKRVKSQTSIHKKYSLKL
jgi:hypothetical protein